VAQPARFPIYQNGKEPTLLDMKLEVVVLLVSDVDRAKAGTELPA
jgi:hypothetical protein